MGSQGYKLRNELDNGLKEYGKDNNLSPLSIIEELVEDFLCSNDYLCVEIRNPLPNIEKIKHAPYYKKMKSYDIQKSCNGKNTHFGCSKSPIVTKEIVNFLISKNWDEKYSTRATGLRGMKQINFLLSEIEKQRDNEL